MKRIKSGYRTLRVRYLDAVYPLEIEENADAGDVWQTIIQEVLTTGYDDDTAIDIRQWVVETECGLRLGRTEGGFRSFLGAYEVAHASGSVAIDVVLKKLVTMCTTSLSPRPVVPLDNSVQDLRQYMGDSRTFTWGSSCTAWLCGRHEILFKFDVLRDAGGRIEGKSYQSCILNPCEYFCTFCMSCVSLMSRAGQRGSLLLWENILLHLREHIEDSAAEALYDRWEAWKKDHFITSSRLEMVAALPSRQNDREIQSKLRSCAAIGQTVIRSGIETFDDGSTNYLAHWLDVIVKLSKLRSFELQYQELHARVELAVTGKIPDWSTFRTIAEFSPHLLFHGGMSGYTVNRGQGHQQVTKPGSGVITINHMAPTYKTALNLLRTTVPTNQVDFAAVAAFLMVLQTNSCPAYSTANHICFLLSLGSDDAPLGQGAEVAFDDDNEPFVDGVTPPISFADCLKIATSSSPTTALGEFMAARNVQFVHGAGSYFLFSLKGSFHMRSATFFRSSKTTVDYGNEMKGVCKDIQRCLRCILLGLCCDHSEFGLWGRCRCCSAAHTTCVFGAAINTFTDMGLAAKEVDQIQKQFEHLVTTGKDADVLEQPLSAGFGLLHAAKCLTRGLRRYVYSNSVDTAGISDLQALYSSDSKIAVDLSAIVPNSALVFADRHSDKDSYVIVSPKLLQLTSAVDRICTTVYPEPYLTIVKSAKMQPDPENVSFMCSAVNREGYVFVTDVKCHVIR